MKITLGFKEGILDSVRFNPDSDLLAKVIREYDTEPTDPGDDIKLYVLDTETEDYSVHFCDGYDPPAEASEDDRPYYVPSDAEARAIAADWHGGQYSAMYAFASTGSILSGLRAEIQTELDNPRIGDAPTASLQHLLNYIEWSAAQDPLYGYDPASEDDSE